MKLPLLPHKTTRVDYSFDFGEALSYQAWLNNPRNRLFIDLRDKLMLRMLKPTSGETVLDIGCGTGVSLQPFLNLGLQATGLDASPYMLDIALKNLGQRVDLYRGFANDLPFDDNSFNYACLNTTLEFVKDPHQALVEACRVAKDKVFIGVLNRYALKGLQRRIKGIFKPTIYNHARFFSAWQVKNMLRTVAGDVPVSWRSVCHLPLGSGTIVKQIEQSSLVQRCPTGAIVGIVAILVPRFRTRPLAIRYRPKQPTSGMATG